MSIPAVVSWWILWMLMVCCLFLLLKWKQEWNRAERYVGKFQEWKAAAIETAAIRDFLSNMTIADFVAYRLKRDAEARRELYERKS